MLNKFLDNLETELNQHANSAEAEADNTDDHIEKMCARFKEEVFRGINSAIHDALDSSATELMEERLPELMKDKKKS